MKGMIQPGVEDFVCLVPSLHLCQGSEAGAEEPSLAWFDRAQCSNSALLGTVAGGDYRTGLALLHGGFFAFGFSLVVRCLCGTVRIELTGLFSGLGWVGGTR